MIVRRFKQWFLIFFLFPDGKIWKISEIIVFNFENWVLCHQSHLGQYTLRHSWQQKKPDVKRIIHRREKKIWVSTLFEQLFTRAAPLALQNTTGQMYWLAPPYLRWTFFGRLFSFLKIFQQKKYWKVKIRKIKFAESFKTG